MWETPPQDPRPTLGLLPQADPSGKNASRAPPTPALSLKLSWASFSFCPDYSHLPTAESGLGAQPRTRRAWPHHCGVLTFVDCQGSSHPHR